MIVHGITMKTRSAEHGQYMGRTCPAHVLRLQSSWEFHEQSVVILLVNIDAKLRASDKDLCYYFFCQNQSEWLENSEFVAPGHCLLDPVSRTQLLTKINYLKSTRDTNCSGVISTKSFQTGFDSILPHKSQKEFTIPATARWSGPFSGPIHRNWLSWARDRIQDPILA